MFRYKSTQDRQEADQHVSEMGKTMHRELKRRGAGSFNNLHLSDLCSKNASLQACQSECEEDQTANTQDDDPADVQILSCEKDRNLNSNYICSVINCSRPVNYFQYKDSVRVGTDF